jgi:hypothetical protein
MKTVQISFDKMRRHADRALLPSGSCPLAAVEAAVLALHRRQAASPDQPFHTCDELL